MKTDLYLVTTDGDRHEDHVPIGVFNGHQLLCFLKGEIDNYKDDTIFYDNRWVSLGSTINVIKLTVGKVLPHT
jgi:hypothetical protein